MPTLQIECTDSLITRCCSYALAICLRTRSFLSHLAGTRISEQSEGGCEGDRGATGGNDARVQPLATTSTSAEVRAFSDEECWDLSAEFAFMVTQLIPLMNKAVDIETLKCFLQFFCDVRTRLPYVEPSIYQHCSSTAEVLKALHQQHYFHAIQLNLLRTIVGKYGCGESKRLLQEYESRIPKSSPLKRSHNELTEEEIESSFSTKRLKVKSSRDLETFCLEDVENTQEALEKYSGVSRDAIVYAKHEPGCVVLTFIIPACTVESFSDTSKREEQLSDLANVGILAIEIDYASIDTEADLAPHPTKLKPSTPEPTSSSEGTGDQGGGDLAKSEPIPEGDEVATEFARRLQQNITSSYES